MIKQECIIIKINKYEYQQRNARTFAAFQLSQGTIEYLIDRRKKRV